MLEALFGSRGSEIVMIFLLARGEGYAQEISQFFGIDISTVQNQLAKLELGGVLVSLLKGRTRIYSFNPRYPFLRELRPLLEKALSLYPPDQRERLLMARRRPRRKGKPL